MPYHSNCNVLQKQILNKEYAEYHLVLLAKNVSFSSQTENLILILVTDKFVRVNGRLWLLWRQPRTRKYVRVYTVKQISLNCLNSEKGLAVKAPVFKCHVYTVAHLIR